MDFLTHTQELISDSEGNKPYAYTDSVGVRTIGIGFNLTNPAARGRITALGLDFDAVFAGTTPLTAAQVTTLFDQDVQSAMTDAAGAVSNFGTLADPRKFVVVDMIFNLGLSGFEGFYGTISAIEAGDFAGAARHMQMSLWYSQVGRRAIRDCAMMSSGDWPSSPVQSASPNMSFVAQALTVPAAPTPNDVEPITAANYIVLRKGLFDATSAVQLHQAFDDFIQSRKSRLAVYFHGGLVDEASGLNNANLLLNGYLSADTYPIFVVWESGIFEVLRDSLPEIVQETIFNRIMVLVSGFLQKHANQGSGQVIAQALQVTGPADATFAAYNTNSEALAATTLPSAAELDIFAHQVDADPTVSRELQLIAASATTSNGLTAQSLTAEPGIVMRTSARTLMSPAVVSAIVGKQSEDSTLQAFGLFDGLAGAFDFGGAVAKIAYSVISRFIDKTDHGMPCTLVEEIMRALYLANAGYAVWNVMKQDTIAAFGGDPLCGGTALLNEMIQSKPNYPMTLIGHSAGAIYVCNFLKAADAVLPTDISFDVIFMAPAVTVALFDETLAAHASRVRKARMFALHDSLECTDAILGPIYPRSLLYFVSGVCETMVDQPLLGMERFMPIYPNLTAAALKGETFLSKTSPVVPNDGEETESEHHGGFPEDAVTNESVEFLLKNGI
jgi:GH24 family phage-related lysozyme (muramidase)